MLIDGSNYVMFYTGGWFSAAMGRATCPLTSDPTVTGNWTKYASNPVLGQGVVDGGAVSGNNVYKIGSTYYCTFYRTGTSSALMISTSSDGITWTTPTQAIAGNAFAGFQGWANTAVFNDGSWKMLVEGHTTGSAWNICYATSANGLAWTVQQVVSSLAVSGQTNYGGPWLANGGNKINGLYHLFYHAGNSDLTDIYHARSTDLVNWTQTGLVLAANLGTYEAQQVADASVIENGGKSYLFYSGVNNNTSVSYINVAAINSGLRSLATYLG